MSHSKHRPFIILSAEEALWPDPSRLSYFLNDGCKLYTRKTQWERYNAQTLSAPLSQPTTFKKVRQEHIDLVPSICKILGTQLNKLHKRNYSSKYWDTLLYFWVSRFLSALQDRYQNILGIQDRFKDWESYVLHDQCFQSFDTMEEQLHSIPESETFNLQIYTQLLKKMGYSFQAKTVNHTLGPTKKAKPKLGIAKAILFWGLRLLAKIPGRRLFFLVGLDTKIIRSLQGTIAGSYQWFVPTETNAPKCALNAEMRHSLFDQIPESDTPFLNIAIEILVENIPTSLVENFEHYEHYTQKHFPKNPESIMSSVGLFKDDYSRFWLAQMREKEVPTLGLQHGGGFGIDAINFLEYIELSIFDRFCTWGWKDSCDPNLDKKVQPLFLSKKILPYQNNPNGKLLYCNQALPRYLYTLDSILYYFDMETYIRWQLRFIDTLTASNKDRFVMRSYSKDFDWNLHERYVDTYPEIKIESMGQGLSFPQSVRESSLVVIDNCQTTMLESLCMGAPSILFWNPDFVGAELRPSVQPYFDDLKSAKILHTSPESAAKIINEIEGHEMEWWQDRQRQDAVQRFCEVFARQSENPRQELIDAFDSLRKEAP